jgi:hypothetical protein
MAVPGDSDNTEASQHLYEGVDGGTSFSCRWSNAEASPWGQGWRKSWPHMCYTYWGISVRAWMAAPPARRRSTTSRHLHEGVDGGPVMIAAICSNRASQCARGWRTVAPILESILRVISLGAWMAVAR